MPYDVIVAGAGPAGALAAAILARSGARVLMFDRTRFPRPKLCGDTLNPGARRLLAAQLPVAAIDAQALALDGMILTGTGVEVRGSYPGGQRALALMRRDLDSILLAQALAAGVQFEDRVSVVAPVVDGARVSGVAVTAGHGTRREQHAAMVIAADGRASRLARAVAIAAHARRPRRWAIGGYFDGVTELEARGEMHVRPGRYIGVAPVPGGLANVCLVLPREAAGVEWGRPAEVLVEAVRGDRRLRERFARARLIDAPQVLGPLAVDARAAGVPGMLLAGDAAGFIDPITGDGLRFALGGAVMAAEIVRDVLAGRLGAADAPRTLAARRRAEFAGKWRFNRGVRLLVDHPAAIAGAALAARAAPAVFEAVIRYAGDCENRGSGVPGFRGSRGS